MYFKENGLRLNTLLNRYKSWEQKTDICCNNKSLHVVCHFFTLINVAVKKFLYI